MENLMRTGGNFRALGQSSTIPCLLVLIFAAMLLPTPLSSQENQQPPLDRRARRYLTHMPHRSGIVERTLPAGQPEVPISPVGPVGRTSLFNASQYVVGPTISPTSTVPEAEEYISVSPQNSNVMLSAISDFALNGGFNTTKYAFSTNNGLSWTESYIPLDPSLGLPATGDGYLWFANSDPVVAIDKQGRAFLSDLYLDAIDNGNGLYVSVANTNTGFKFTINSTYRVKTNPSASTTQLEDKPWITVDNSKAATSGYVYASWSHFYNSTTDYIAFSRSTNHGKTWSSLKRISPPSQDGAVQGSSLAVGPKGEIYLVYEVFYASNQCQQFLAKSTNGGSSFSNPVAVTPIFNDLTFTSTYRKNSFASLGVNPLNGYLYMIYPDQPGASSQVEFTRSTDGGKTFSPAAAINDSPDGQRFFIALAVDSAGNLHASWFDTRNSAGNAALYDVYATFSKDGGLTFATNARVTAAPADAGTTSFIGDYSGIAAGGGYAHPVWTNGGGNNGQLQTSALQLP
jgi:hypothetical protein